MKKLIVLNALGLASPSAWSGFSTWNARDAKATMARLGGYTAVTMEAGEIRTSMVAMSDAMRGFLLNPAKTEEYAKKKQADEAFSAAVKRLLAATSNPEYADIARQIGKLDEDQLDPIENRVLDLAAHDAKKATQVYFDEYLPVREKQMLLVERLRTSAGAAFTTEDHNAGVRMDFVAGLVLKIGSAIIVAMGLAFGWSAWATNLMSRRIGKETVSLGEVAGSVLRTAREVSASAQSLSQGATEQAASLEETSASMEEMASMARRNAEHTQEAAGLMVQVDQRVADSNQALREMVTLDGGDRDLEREGREDHQDDRRDCVPDQHPGAQRGGGSGARRRSGDGLRGRGRRGQESGAAIGAGGQGHSRVDRRIDRPIEGRVEQGGSGGDLHRGDHRERQAGPGDRRGSARGQPAADAGARPGVAGDRADGESDPDDRRDRGRKRGGERRAAWSGGDITGRREPVGGSGRSHAIVGRSVAGGSAVGPERGQAGVRESSVAEVWSVGDPAGGPDTCGPTRGRSGRGGFPGFLARKPPFGAILLAGREPRDRLSWRFWAGVCICRGPIFAVAALPLAWAVVCLASGQIGIAAGGPPVVLLGNRDFPPLSYLERGEPRGFDVDVAKELEKALGREIHVELMDWPLARDKVLRGEANGLIDFGFSEERAQQYHFTETTVTHEFRLFVRTSEVTRNGVGALDGKVVGVTPGGFPQVLLGGEAAHGWPRFKTTATASISSQRARSMRSRATPGSRPTSSSVGV